MKKLKLASLLFLKLSYCFSNGIGSNSCPSRILLAPLFCQNLTLQWLLEVTQLSGALEKNMKNVGGSHSWFCTTRDNTKLHTKPGAIIHMSHGKKQRRLIAGKPKENSDDFLQLKEAVVKKKLLTKLKRKLFFSHWKRLNENFMEMCYSSLITFHLFTPQQFGNFCKSLSTNIILLVVFISFHCMLAPPYRGWSKLMLDFLFSFVF